MPMIGCSEVAGRPGGRGSLSWATALWISFMVFMGGCEKSTAPDPTLRMNPYGLGQDDLSFAAGETIGAMADLEALQSWPNPYGFRTEDVDYAEAERMVAEERLETLRTMLTSGDFRQLGDFIGSLGQINQGLNYWGGRLQEVETVAVPYWEEQSSAARDARHDAWIEFCERMLANLDLEQSLSEATISNLQADEQLHYFPIEGGRSVATRKAALQESVIAYYSDLVEVIGLGLTLDLTDCNRALEMIAPLEEIPADSLYWMDEREKIATQSEPFWEDELREANRQQNEEWKSLCEGMLLGLALRDQLASAILSDLAYDHAWGISGGSELCENVATRKAVLARERFNYYSLLQDLVAQAMSLATR